ncbi:MAG: helix-turn-helix transcriptional regulator [Lachnospiraceae bacterium]|nr:helix-turn-helix transcriptional regulator [Lachnospiraceae bacterium]
MIRAYSESYLNNAKSCLAVFFDYAINDCAFSPDWLSKLFVTTGIAEQFERGNPAYIAGMSGVELAREVINLAYGRKELPEPYHYDGCSPEYWAGWALAEYQWYTGRRFRDIFDRLPLSEIISMYTVYHEMDITSFIDSVEEKYRAVRREPKLKQIRESRGLSQNELAERSGVNVRSIRSYEQRGNEIDKAQAQTLYRLSRVLGCTVEDLLENPMDDTNPSECVKDN